MAKAVALVTLAILLRVASPTSWSLSMILSQNDLPNGPNPKCDILVDQNVQEEVTVPSCNNAEISVTLNNEYRARCVNHGTKCRTVTTLGEEFTFADPWDVYPWGCVPVPSTSTSVQPNALYNLVTHTNFPINTNGCNTHVTIKYINATNCRCLPFF